MRQSSLRSAVCSQQSCWRGFIINELIQPGEQSEKRRAARICRKKTRWCGQKVNPFVQPHAQWGIIWKKVPLPVIYQCEWPRIMGVKVNSRHFKSPAPSCSWKKQSASHTAIREEHVRVESAPCLCNATPFSIVTTPIGKNYHDN